MDTTIITAATVITEEDEKYLCDADADRSTWTNGDWERFYSLQGIALA